jgi:cation:H+ antiporter
MTVDLLLFLVGLVALYFGAEWLVEGASRLARSFGISAFVVGLTVVAFGTSAPELLVSSLAAVQGSGDIAVGNVVGSNIANIALILGVSALIYPVAVHRGLVVRDLPVMVGFAALLEALAWNGGISRAEGGLLLVLFAAYMAHVVLASRRERGMQGARDGEEGEDAAEEVHRGRTLLLTLLGLVVLVGGAHLLVTSAVSMARVLGVPEIIIGLTLVAFGTSVPELAASVAAARRREGQIVIGNIVGSNIFNVSLILGTAALLHPLEVARSVVTFDGPVMIGLSLLLVPLVYTGMRLNRWEGGALLAGYLGFVGWTVL